MFIVVSLNFSEESVCLLLFDAENKTSNDMELVYTLQEDKMQKHGKTATQSEDLFGWFFIRHSRNYKRTRFMHPNSTIRQCESSRCFGQSLFTISDH